MSGIQKIIAVALLLMSCAFVYASLDRHTTEKEDAERNASIQADQDGEIEDLKADNNRLSATIKGKDILIGKNAEKINLHEGNMTALQTTLDNAQKKVAKLSTDTGSQSAMIANLEKKNENTNTELGKRNAEIKQLRVEIDNKNGEISVAKQSQADADVALVKEKEARAADADNHKQAMVKKQGELDAEIRKNSGNNKILNLNVTCSVLNVSRENDFTLITLNKGKADRLEPGIQFIVYNRKGEYKGTIELVTVEAGKSVARIIDEVEGKRIVENDLAQTKSW